MSICTDIMSQEIISMARNRDWDRVQQYVIDHNLACHLSDIRVPNTGDTLLHIAVAQSANHEVLGQLIEFIDINTPNKNDLTPLSIFFINYRRHPVGYCVSTLYLLLNHGAQPMRISKGVKNYGWTPYMFAAFYKVGDVIIQILQRYGGTLSNVKDLYGGKGSEFRTDYDS